MKPGQSQIFKNRLLKTIHKSIKKRRVQNWKIQFRFDHMTRKYGQDEKITR